MESANGDGHGRLGELLRGIRDELAGIRQALERVCVADAPDDAPFRCVHPEDQRIDFGVTDGAEDWLCRACGYRTVPPDGASQKVS